MVDADWTAEAKKFYAARDWIGALSSARNALRLDVKNLMAWHIGCDTLMEQDRQHQAGKFARALKRFASRAGEEREIAYADMRIAEIAEYFASYHRRAGETDLTHFAARGDLEQVRGLLESGINPNERNTTNWTALHRVAVHGQPEMACLLVQQGADVEAADDLKETPLITACRFGNAKLIPVLLELGASVGHAAKEKHTALWYAIGSMKDAAIVKMLIDAGADANETYEYGDNPFLIAVSAQAPDIINLLLPLTEDLARMNKHQVCALHFAASYDDAGLMEKLIERGINVNMTTSAGFTALMRAAENNAVKAARVLITHGARLDLKSQYGDTAVSLAENREQVEVYELLTGGRLDRRRENDR